MSSIFNGILNFECTVEPFFNKVAAIPEDEEAQTFLFTLFIYLIIKLIRCVLPVPPAASI